MKEFYSLLYNEVYNKLYNYFYPPEPDRKEPLQIANPIWLNEFREKYSIWIIESAYLRYKRFSYSPEKLYKLWEESFNESMRIYCSK
jgi:hypothetical protein